MELAKNGNACRYLCESGAIVKTAFCGPCFGAGDTPANNAFSIRHSTRNFPNREGSKVQNGQIVISCTYGCTVQSQQQQQIRDILTAATDLDVEYKGPKYHFDKSQFMQTEYLTHKDIADPDYRNPVWTKYQGLAGNGRTYRQSYA